MRRKESGPEMVINSDTYDGRAQDALHSLEGRTLRPDQIIAVAQVYALLAVADAVRDQRGEAS